MEKMLALRSLYRSLCSRSYQITTVNHQMLRYYSGDPTLSSTSYYYLPFTLCNSATTKCKSPLSKGLGQTIFFNEDASHLPIITDPELHRASKDLLAASWNELPDVVISDAGKEVVANVFHSAEVFVEFGDMVMNLMMELDDIVGMSGENFLFLFSFGKDRMGTGRKTQTLTVSEKVPSSWKPNFSASARNLRKKMFLVTFLKTSNHKF
ncbi:hypothetical protein UlMin_023490 [Ulmus minor]